MKTVITLVIIFLTAPIIVAKGIAPELGITPSVRWSEIISGTTLEQQIIHQYEIGQDTVINELSYYKLMKDNVLYGAVREDEERQVFVYFPDTQQEHFLYDFNWENKTGSIRLFNNQPYAIRESEYGRIIQGIGSLSGFFAPLYEAGTSTTELLCYWKNEQLLYLNPNYTNCEGGKTYKSCFGKEYTKYTVINIPLTDGHTCSETYVINEQLELSTNAYFVEDLSSGKLTFNWRGKYERQIMNLNVWVGDTILLGNELSCFYLKKWFFDSNGKDIYYALVDSIYFEDNRKHIRMDILLRFFTESYDSHYVFKNYLFIEGRGPNTGLFQNIGSESCTYLLCYETESEFYLNPRFEECYYHLGMPSTKSLEPIEISQVNQILQVHFATSFSGRLYLYDSLGRIQQKTIVSDQTEVMLGVEHLLPGIYILKCHGIDGIISKAIKIIIY